MGERLYNKASPAESANFVDKMHARAGGLSQLGKSLGEVDPIVANFVEVDTKSPDFGRVKNVCVAKYMADKRNKAYYEGHAISANWRKFGMMTEQEYQTGVRFDDAQMDRNMARTVHMEVALDHTPEKATKVAQDYLITQGDNETMEQRKMDIFDDFHHRMVNPFAAAADIGRSIKAARQARKAKRD